MTHPEAVAQKSGKHHLMKAAAVVAVVAVIARLRVRFSENDLMPRANRCCLMPAQTPHSLP